MGCLCSKTDEVPKTKSTSIPVAEVNCQTSYQPTFVAPNPNQDKIPLLNAVSPSNFDSEDSDTSEVDQDMINTLLRQVSVSSDED
jgi:hypothetical protein